ncbi:hypothetical protein [uncultured Clostridium sp.]|nr:hypothetical protein [uncultured Clostridium sp.]
MKKNKALEILKDLRYLSANFEEYEVKPYDVEALEYAIKLIQETDYK